MSGVEVFVEDILHSSNSWKDILYLSNCTSSILSPISQNLRLFELIFAFLELWKNLDAISFVTLSKSFKSTTNRLALQIQLEIQSNTTHLLPVSCVVHLSLQNDIFYI